MTEYRGNLTGRQQSSPNVHTLWATLCHGSACAVSLTPVYRQAGLTTMQGRAGKAPKREMVIESPQQYKSLAEIEAEVETGGSQVAAVSVCWAIFYIEVKLIFIESSLVLVVVNGTNVI